MRAGTDCTEAMPPHGASAPCPLVPHSRVCVYLSAEPIHHCRRRDGGAEVRAAAQAAAAAARA